MKRLLTRDEFIKNKINEGFLSDIFKNIKNKISMNFSKMFGSASKVDKIMEDYKKEILKTQEQKKDAISKYLEYVKSVKKGGENDLNTVKELQNNILKVSKNFDEQISIIKDKFKIKFNDIIKDESNDKIKDYINLKKLELQQEILKNETNIIIGDSQMSEDEIKKDPIFSKLISDINAKIKTNIEQQESIKKSLESKAEKSLDFDIDKAKSMANSGDVYLWEESPMKDYKFKNGDIIEYFSKANNGLTNATVEEDKGERIVVKTEKGNTVEINRLTIANSVNFDDENKKDEENNQNDNDSSNI